MRTKQPPLERFMRFVQKEPDGGCWNWVGAKTNGYGNFGVNGKNIRAHRFLILSAIPVGGVACHKCDNTACVNPDHIFIGTQKENVRDCIRKGRFMKRLNHNRKIRKVSANVWPARKLSESEVFEVLVSERKFGSVIVLCDAFKTSHKVIRNILTGRTYNPSPLRDRADAYLLSNPPKPLTVKFNYLSK